MDISVEHSVILRNKNKKYLKGELLGKGGYGECYRVTNVDTEETFALKIVPKKKLVSKRSKEKMKQEILIHKTLRHENIVAFHGFFEDQDHVYVMLELCEEKSMMELLRQQKVLTEPQVRYFLRQIASGCRYLHEQKIVHRDLKLNNLLLDRSMNIKVGDFGFSTRIDFDGERKKSTCGTLCYTAPEILNKDGHSYEVDSWSLGVILYTLLVGHPPFVAEDAGMIRSLIRENKYNLPSKGMSESAKNLIKKLLSSEPSLRLTMQQVLLDEFLTKGVIPVTVRFDETPSHSTPISALNGKLKALTLNKLNGKSEIRPEAKESGLYITGEDKIILREMHESLVCIESAQIISKMNSDKGLLDDNAEPIYWLRVWMYWDQYGLLYLFSTNSIGYKFKDSTWITLENDGRNIKYTDIGESDRYYTLESNPSLLDKKICLLRSSQKHLQSFREAGNVTLKKENLASIPVVKMCVRSQDANYFYLSDGTLQINFSIRHDKLVVCPARKAIVYIDCQGSTLMTTFTHIEKHGCTKILLERLRYARKLVKMMLEL